MASSSPWGAWGSKLNVTSIVSQGLEQVRSLREDMEKSFDHVVTGVPGPRSAVQLQIEDKQVANKVEVASLNKADVVSDNVGTVSDTADTVSDTVDTAIDEAVTVSNTIDTVVDTAAVAVSGDTLIEAFDPNETVEENCNANIEQQARREEDTEIEQLLEPDDREELQPGATAEVVDEEEEKRDEEFGGEGRQQKLQEEVEQLREGEEEEEEEEKDQEEEEEGKKLKKKKKKKQKKKRRKREAALCTTEEPSGDVVIEEKAGGARGEAAQAEVLVAVVEDVEEGSGNVAGDAEEAVVRAEDGRVAVADKEEEIVDDLQQQVELKARESQLLAASTTIRNLHDELDETRRREVVAVERAQLLTEQLENSQQEVAKLTQMYRDRHGSSQRNDVQVLQLALAGKEEKLSALLDEGQALSVKQAQLEQRLRLLRKEKDELEERALKAQSQAEASAGEVQRLMSKLKASEKETTCLAQRNRQLTSIADTASARIEKAEHDALEATQQLKKLRAQVDELTRSVADKDEEIVRLAMSSQSSESLHLEKAELEQTLQFLQDNVRDLEAEGTRREVMARAEITDLKRKWQDALARVDLLGQSVSEATQPLLRQIHALQEDQRARQESWKAMETTFVARIEEATEQRRAAMQERVEMEERLHEFREKVEKVELELIRKQAELVRAQDTAASAKAEARALHGQVDALQIDLDQAKHQRDAEAGVKEQLQTRLLAAEKSIETARVSSTTTLELEQSRKREEQLRQDLEWHRQELQRLKNAAMQAAPVPLSIGHTSSHHQNVRRSLDGEQSFWSESADGESSSEASILKMALATDPLTLTGGNTSVLGLSQLQQRLRLREGENRMLKQQLETLEARQKQTTDEIVRLSSRNALLESGEAQLEQTQSELAKLQKHQVVLLELFGEKEEQVEELQAEVKELKAFYRKQLNTLATHSEQQQKQQLDQ
uniref:TATA element modulatory factor 1 TATA binding domain-containing protein n=1 Tax=Peronospora matthiolae TaxID=2874970 RepID=A0AAV1TLN2_9STRA